MYIGLDFDGTLLDSRERHKVALRHAAEAENVALPQFFENIYFQEKIEGASGLAVLKKHKIEKSEKINDRWIALIEADEMLALDVLYPNVKQILTQQTERGAKFVLVTLRKRQEAAQRQIMLHGLDSLCKSIFVVSHAKSKKKGAGSLCAKAEVTQQLNVQAVIGDTEIDQRWASDLTVPFFASAWGFRSRKYWEDCHIRCYQNLASIFSELKIL